MLMLFTSCGPPPTPFAITPVATQPPTAAEFSGGVAPNLLPTREPVRYGVLAHSADYIPRETWQALNAQVSVLTEQVIPDEQDILVGFGTYDGWMQSPVTTHITLILNTSLAPLDNAEIAALVRSAVQPNDIITGLGIAGVASPIDNVVDYRATRTTLANIGYPDGITIYGKADSLPGTDAMLTTFEAANIDVVNVPLTQLTPHLTVTAWRTEEERAALVSEFGAENVIDLYTLPISYLPNSDLLTTFTDDGWVIAARTE